MKKNTLQPNKKIGSEQKDKNYDDQFTPSENEMDVIIPYWFAGNYSGHLMPMTDISFVFDELKKLFDEWLTAKNKN